MEQKRFISKISRIAQGYTMKALRGLDMNLSELHALRSITWLPGQSQTELSERLSVDKAAIARTITRLEKKGYIRRQEDEKDRRINRLYPLEKASQVKEESISVENDFYDWLFEVLEPAERQKFLETLDLLTERAKEERRAGFIHALGRAEDNS